MYIHMLTGRIVWTRGQGAGARAGVRAGAQEAPQVTRHKRYEHGNEG